jgi:23S rRNA pseudouridine2605 synthase
VSAERLQKVLAGAGIASRRDCEALIAAGRVTVNGRVVQEPGLRVDPDQDVVLLDGKPVRQPAERTYLMLHKPVGFVSTADDPHGRPTVVELVDVPGRVFPVGRLDVDSEGLILLTDDGELTHHLTHPSFEVEKEYRVLLDGDLDADALRQWRNGVLLNGEMTAPATVALIESGDDGFWYRVVLREGRKRQIREVAKLLGREVRRLIRVREGGLLLGDLPLREWRKLTDEEVAALRAHVPAPRPHDADAADRRLVRATLAAGGTDDYGAARTEDRAPRERPSRYGDERPRQGGDDRRDDRSRDGSARPPRAENDFRRDERPRYGDRPPRPDNDFRRDDRSRDGSVRPPRADNDFRRDERPRYGNDRPRQGGGGDYRRDERPRYGDDRPRQGGGDYRRDDRSRDGSVRPPRADNDFRRDDRPRQGGGGGDYRRDERPRYGDDRPRQGGGGGDYRRDERPPRERDDRSRQGGDARRDEGGPPRPASAAPVSDAPPPRAEGGERQERESSRAGRPTTGGSRGRSTFRSRPGGRPNFSIRPKGAEDDAGE